MPTVYNATDICNYGLAKLGGGGESAASFQISSIFDSSNRTSILCLQLYGQIRKEVLCAADWPEATKYAELGAELSGIEKGDWEYAFRLPTDYLGRARLINESYHRSTKPQYISEYDKEIVQDMLFCNEYTNADDDTAYIKYIFNLQNVSKFSDLLVEAIATKLAAELSGPLLADYGKRRAELLQEYYNIVLPNAIGQQKMAHGDDTDLGEYPAETCRTD